MKKFCYLISAICCLLFTPLAEGASRTAKQNVIATTSNAKIGEKIDASEKYNDACYEDYFGCMDQFCMSDNESGGRCMCSTSYSQYEEKLKQIEKNTDEANRIATIEVEKIKAGAKADILFSGNREYDKDGNVVTVEKKETKAKKRLSVEDFMNIGQEDGEEEFSLEGLTGKGLYDGARSLCLEQVQESCDSRSLAMQTTRYQTQMRDDCTALSKNIDDLLRKSQLALLEAQKDVRTARDEAFEKDNEYDRGTCMIEFKKCMQGTDACGADWTRCVNTVAAENMQNNMAVSTAGTKVAITDKFEISASTQEMLSSKRNVCESILDKCLANRDNVWPDFLRDVAPELKIAETKAESIKRQSCLGDISDCIQKACKDDIAQKGTATMDACLARPDMARSFCKNEIDPCERMEPQIWDYVVSKLAALRVDACTDEVKACYTDEGRCGSDFSKCIGMDYNFLHRMCPIDKLVVCKGSKPNFKLEDIDEMLMGFFLNVDNSALDVCQQRIDDKMMEVCGSTTDCNRFASDDTIGTNSLRSQKDGDIFRVTGMLSFGMINMGNGDNCDLEEGSGEECTAKNRLGIGEIGVKQYISKVRALKDNKNIAGSEGIIDSVEAELLNIAGTINRVVNTIESDQEIQYCIKGRDLSQITGGTRGSRNNTTTARFPNLMNNQRMLIAASALRQANENYNRVFNKMVADATKNASLDIAQYMCQNMAGGGAGGLFSGEADTPLAPPYSVSYEIGAGLTIDKLTSGGGGTVTMGQSKDSGGGIYKTQIARGNSSINKTAVFSRETRTCHVCTTISEEKCSTSGSKSWFHNSMKTNCNTTTRDPQCEDIPM